MEDRVPTRRPEHMWTHYCIPAITAIQSAKVQDRWQGMPDPQGWRNSTAQQKQLSRNTGTTKRPESKTKNNGHTPHSAEGKMEEQQFRTAAVVDKAVQAGANHM